MKWIANKPVDTSIINELMQTNLDTNQFTNNGCNVRKLEKFVKSNYNIDDSKCVIAVTNGAVALQCLTSAIAFTENININWATQSFTFPPSAQSTLSNCTIVDCDNEGGLDLNKLEPDINGIIITNVFGNLVDISKYEQWAQEKNRFLIFDNAAAHYSFYNNKNSLNYGEGATISFHHTKPFGFGEGGCIITDCKYEKQVRGMSNFGIGLTDKYWLREGNNYKMSEISAIYILQYLLTNFENIKQKTSNLYQYFVNKINEENIKLVMYPSFHDTIICPSSICILYDNNIDSDIVVERLHKNNIEARKYYIPLEQTDVAMNIYSRIVCLPCNIDMTTLDIDFIIKLLHP